MIDSVFLGPTELTTPTRILTRVTNLTFPFIQFSATRKSGFAGQSVSPSNFASYKFAFEFTLGGNTFAQLAQEREDFTALLGLILSQGENLLQINKTNGTDTQIEILGVDIDSNIDAREANTSVFRIELEAEYPFLQDQTEQNESVLVFSGGGMEIPMPIPMDMSMGGLNEVTITNGGNADAFPLFTFTGALGTPSLTNITTDKTFNLSTSLASPTDIIIVDTFLRTVIINPGGTNGRRFASGDFWTLAPGDNLIRLGSGIGTGSCLVTFRDHYYGI